ncbi:beta-hydroxyacid dehydrogenase, 3-hydroxyisobutyrate dehydrogenase [Desulfitobacterium dichloroeliminans LMG P-21439]|uniref:Beta-hydroxyacid dehydrogenase, 3-hydroxyisobutyrate dehydrogenase n=1 Tax=Desulfitobacterium dichloroeliminans (strain LMG P-21439 / DCA1) TaxID=871963 RepID=L0F6J5_DESDL|nr:NAD(P)-dependent oxidoreductase [Desulfitobacterium dichloroeliminans]AGA68558.1 beta-hydroxyacid dehydrogenase, 3-hydroxyisobutyrate dehydrogenase [Desulfitobacterium dichloroeliminans LMG P-21439]
MKDSTVKHQIGFIGTGVMGRSMVKNLLNAGYSVSVYNRTKASAEELFALGAVWVDTVAELAQQSDVIITMVGYPKDVEEVYLNKEGLIPHAKPGSVLIDMTTSSPILAKKIAEQGKARRIDTLDAPVSGGDVGAKNGTLVIMVGGEEKVFHSVKPVLEAMGKNIILQGPAGAGQYTKMSNQVTIAAGMVGVCEAIAYAQKAGLDPTRVLESIAGGAAGSWSLSNLGPRMIAGNFEPGFYVKHFIKDMKIALESAQEMGLLTPGLELAKSLYERLAAEGEENSGTHALYKLYIK